MRPATGRLCTFCLFCVSVFAHPWSGRTNDAGFGGTLIFSQRAEPKTLNPLTSIEQNSREVIGLINADLIHINRLTQQVEPALADRWNVSNDGRRVVIHLRPGLRFSDGWPCTADDVLFTFKSYLDPQVNSPQRDMLTIAGKPITVEKVDDLTLVFELTEPYAAADRLFDGVAILPQHLLEQSAREGRLNAAWGLQTPGALIAGMGCFRLKAYLPGQRIVLERNPFYWKKDGEGRQLPYLDRIVATLAASADAESMQFDAGETDIINGISPTAFASLEKDQSRRRFRLYDLGPGLEYLLLFFNENSVPAAVSQSISRKQRWFRQTAFRKALSSAIDRQAIVKLAYAGRASPLSIPVTPGDKRWVDRAIPPPETSLDRSRELLQEAGFSWARDGSLYDDSGVRVEFSLAFNAGKPQQSRMAALIQQDLKQLGIQVDLDPLEFRTLLDDITNTFKYEAAIIGLTGGDTDPNSDIGVFSSTGSTHFWSLKPSASPEPWQKQIDLLMQKQMVTVDYDKRKSIYNNVQQLLWENVPVICLISPHILLGAKDRVGNFNPAILADYALWNADLLYIRP